MESKSKDDMLLKAITSADEASLRAVVFALSTKSEEIRDTISDHLLAMAIFNKINSDSSGVKRKASSPVYICRRCGYGFDLENNRKSCRYHPENSLIDLASDVWDYWNYNLHRPKDTPENRKKNHLQGGFIYPCCDRSGDRWMDTGCRRGYPQAADGKRGNYDIEDPDDESCPEEWYSDELDEDDDEDDEDDEEDEEDEA